MFYIIFLVKTQPTHHLGDKKLIDMYKIYG